MFNPVWKLIPFDRALNCMQYIWIWQHSHTQHWRKLYFNSANCLIRGNSWWIWYFHIGVQMTYLFLHPIMHLLLFFSPDWVTFGHVIISRFFIYFLFHRPFYISICNSIVCLNRRLTPRLNVGHINYSGEYFTVVHSQFFMALCILQYAQKPK